MSNTLYVLDIDGTLADASRRFKEAGPEPRKDDKEAYTKWVQAVQNHHSLLADVPVPGMVKLANAVAKSAVYVTSRVDEFRDTTRTWLMKHGFPALTLYMRHPQDWSSSGDYKMNVIDALAGAYSAVVVIDDDPLGDIEAACKERGYTFLKCRTGGY